MEDSSSNSRLKHVATLTGHTGAVTAIACPADTTKNFIVSASRDKTAIVWELTRNQENYGVAKRALHGHNHFVQDITLSADGRFALTASWDKTMRLWNLATGKTEASFIGHSNDVMSVSFSPDNRLIVSASRDKTIKVWNTRGDLKGEFTAASGRSAAASGHTEWVSCVRYSPDAANPMVVTAGWDKMIKVWDMKGTTPQLAVNHSGHAGYCNTVAISPDGTLCASGGKDATVMLWDLHAPKHLYSLEAGDIIHTLIFSPNRYWLCAATSSSIKIWDLYSKTIVDDLKPEFTPTKSGQHPECISLAWSADGSTLYAGYTDNKIRVWEVVSRN